MTRIPVGIQLYTLRDETNLDFIGTLKKVADIGFQVVEFAGYGDLPAKELTKVLSDLGLGVCSSHVALSYLDSEKLKSQVASQIEYNLEIGSEYIVTPYAPLDKMTTVSELEPYLDAFRYVGEECQRAGIGYAYQNFSLNLIRSMGSTS